MSKTKILSVLLIALALITGTALASPQSTKLTFRGTTTLGTGTAIDSNVTYETTTEIHGGIDRVANRPIPRSGLVAISTLPSIPNPQGNAITLINPGFFGFNGVTHSDQRLAGTGAFTNTQFSKEPPDQALSIGNGFVLEVVNTALAVYSTSGKRLTASKPINQFFNMAPEINRTTNVFGDFTTDPKSYYDPGTNRWFLTVSQYDKNSSTGDPSGRSHLELAVSQTGDPTGAWNLFSIDTTDDGNNGTPNHPNCPCFGDQPLIGADANGFYISTNEFSLFSTPFNGAQIYAMSKKALAAGTLPVVVQINASQYLVPFGGLSYSIQPATVPQGAAFATDKEYFLSALDFSGTLDNRIAVWALTNTSSLNSTSPNLNLTLNVIDSETYSQPLPAQQKEGFRYLGTIYIPQQPGGKREKLEMLNSNDDRMNQVVFSDGKLWSGVNTVVKTKDGSTRVGIAYFIVAPSWTGDTLGGSIVNQGYVAVNRNNVMFPSIGVNAAGKGVMTFTLVGMDYFPSAAYTPIDAINGSGNVHIAKLGASPEDGFTGYSFYGYTDGVARWGDYSAAVAAPDGSIWIGVEYIPMAPRTALANWGTFISNVKSFSK